VRHVLGDKGQEFKSAPKGGKGQRQLKDTFATQCSRHGNGGANAASDMPREAVAGYAIQMKTPGGPAEAKIQRVQGLAHRV